MANPQITVLLFGKRQPPRSVATLPSHTVDGAADIDAAVHGADRVLVFGTDADLAAVLTQLMRTERLDIEVAHLRGRWGAMRARTAGVQRVPLIRDETGTVVVGSAQWLPPSGASTVHGEAVVDDSALFNGEVAGVWIEPTPEPPGLRAALMTGPLRRRRWISGRAVQLGTTGVQVVRDDVPAPREARRSTFYRHTTGWLRVRF